MIPAAREHEDDMRVPSDPYLWQSDDGSLTAFARADCPTADDALWTWSAWCGYGWRGLVSWPPSQRVRLGWSVEDPAFNEPGWWFEVASDAPGAVECWMVET